MHMHLTKLKNSLNKTRCYNNPSGMAAKNGEPHLFVILHKKTYSCTINCQFA